MLKQNCNSDGELLRNAYVEHEPVDFVPIDDGRTRQEFADECDINVILARYEKTGVISHFNDGTPQYLDLDGMPSDLQGALLYVELAKEAFMRLPAVVRREFDNDPVLFADFAANPENVDQMREWGLAAPAPAAGALGASAGGDEPPAVASSPASSA